MVSQRQYLRPEDITIELLEEALRIAADIVNRYGASCTPVFERPERELVQMHRDELAIKRAKQIVTTGDLSAYKEAAKQDPLWIYRTTPWGPPGGSS